MIPGLRWNAPGTRSRSSNDVLGETRPRSPAALTQSPTFSAPAATSTAGPSPNQASPLRASITRRISSLPKRSRTVSSTASQRQNSRRLLPASPTNTAAPRHRPIRGSPHRPPCSASANWKCCLSRSTRPNDVAAWTRLDHPTRGSLPWPTAGQRGVARRVARSQRRDDRRRLRAQHQATHRPARATRGERHRSRHGQRGPPRRRCHPSRRRSPFRFGADTMSVEKGTDWGERARPPADLVVVDDSAAAVEMIAPERRASRPLPAVGLRGGDLYVDARRPHHSGSGLGRGGVARHGRPRCRPRRWRPALVPRPSHRSSIMATGTGARRCQRCVRRRLEYRHGPSR